MQRLEDIEDKIYAECKKILESLSAINSKEDLLEKEHLIQSLTDRISFFKIVDENKASLDENRIVVESTPFEIPMEVEYKEQDTEEEFDSEMEEEALFNNEFNQIGTYEDEKQAETVQAQFPAEKDEEELELVKEIHQDDEGPKTVTLSVDPVEDFETNEIQNNEETHLETQIEMETLDHEQKQQEIEVEENAKKIENEDRRKIIEFETESSSQPLTTASIDDKEETSPISASEKKFKLAHIKGLKSVQSLFDEDPLDEQVIESIKPGSSEQSLAKSNIPTDYMEAEKSKPAFRLDLNDKIAFSQHLFDGSQVELNETISILNEFKTLDEAKEYLSEVYYERNWQKVDDYAQRLWSLVENKFL